MFQFFWVPAAAFLFCVMLVFALRPLAVRIGLIDRPDFRKRHEGNVPLIGGIAITLAIWVCMLLFLQRQGYYSALLGGLTLLAIIGVADDLQNLSPVTKLVMQLVAAILMTSWGGVYLISLGDLLGHREIVLGNWGIPLTLFAVVSVVNAMNMCDGLDGLCGGLALIAFGWFAYLAGEVGNLPAQRICVIFVGALLGFLIFNTRNPLRRGAKVFLGDAGSLMLGFAIVWFSVELSQDRYNLKAGVPPVVMLWILGFILIDLLAVVMRRTLKGKNPLSADRTHLHHMLLRLNLTPNCIVWLILMCNALMGAIGIIGWKLGASQQLLFALFLFIALTHLLFMRNAWRLIRVCRKMLRR
ncbi:undecaprenyl/decaprenyl-phosphate alpha-N-acetylglucosaminyl 1-phosphate transferase [Cupriavidus cauae]|uniref:undecaprenyl/decaprenyl-phosphate alpha-N-acetylglucosaminyl 1-phosphate transferase n=1 Tax=Cupriavidus cauae TaxID=2608999 RepID=UPI0022448F4E|nr:undecaprenyl/decaprenyl-phosphate alpha-N-acetylglucosaminyl 1-phosphate transferase [Cupriavidus cauae]UZN50273.1 undecaprenyl/decaprenyl-phosphate alpha-N-acetylglucosaminyl 1-phosphate transferase [Cupriavidus cauae]